MNLQINEIFFSPQGEGTFSGVPMLFVRLFRCNLDCSWCDQPNALTTRPRQVSYELSVEEVADTIVHFPLSVPVCFTGGEPLVQHAELVALIREVRAGDEEEHLRAAVRHISQTGEVLKHAPRLLTVETNGTIYNAEVAKECFMSISPKTTLLTVDGRATMHSEPDLRRWIMSAAGASMHLKFVVESEKHFQGILGWLDRFVPREFRSSIPVYFQPEWFKGREAFTDLIKSKMKPEEWEPIAALGFKSIRFAAQMHKALAVR